MIDAVEHAMAQRAPDRAPPSIARSPPRPVRCGRVDADADLASVSAAVTAGRQARRDAANLVVRSPIDIGPAKARRRSTAGSTHLEGSFGSPPPSSPRFRTFLATDLQARALAVHLDASDHRRIGGVSHHRAAGDRADRRLSLAGSG